MTENPKEPSSELGFRLYTKSGGKGLVVANFLVLESFVLGSVHVSATMFL